MSPLTLHVLSRRALPALFLLVAATSTLCASATFYGVGQLPGGAVNGEIRDAAVTSTGILATGNAQQNPGAAFSDTAVIWTPAAGLQTLASLNNIPVPPGGRLVTGSQIAAGNHAIAARISTDATGRAILPALYNQGGPLTAVLGMPSGLVFGAANSVSSNGQTVYGFGVDESGNYQSFRWTVSEGAVPLPAISGYAAILATPRGCSDNVAIDIGAASTASGMTFGPGSAAYEYSTSSGMSVLPVAPGGTWAGASGIDPTGTYVVGCGDTPTNPNGEILLWTSGAVSTLGVPAAESATGMAPNFAGVTRNGVVVVVAGALGSYIHNSYGWFDLQQALVAGGADLSGWNSLNVLGTNGEGTLVFGSGAHGGGTEGFVAQVSAGYLDNFGKPKKKG